MTFDGAHNGSCDGIRDVDEIVSQLSNNWATEPYLHILYCEYTNINNKVNSDRNHTPVAFHSRSLGGFGCAPAAAWPAPLAPAAASSGCAHAAPHTAYAAAPQPAPAEPSALHTAAPVNHQTHINSTHSC